MLLIEELLISPLFLLSVVVFVGFFGWLFAVKIFVVGDKFWRMSNCIVLFVTSLGVFGVVQDSRLLLYEREYNKSQSRIESVYKWRLLSNLNENSFKFDFFEVGYDSNNIDDIQYDYHIACQWIRNNKQYFTNCYNNKEQINIDSLGFPILKNVDSVLESYFNNLDHCITDYNNDITELREYERGKSHNDFELYYIFISPFFIAFGIGWEFVKLFARR